ncbi:MAG: TonB-dependent receptor domain-containing protein [Gemmatimonadales bacterium]
MNLRASLCAAAAITLAVAAPLFSQDTTATNPPAAPLLQRRSGAVVFDSLTLRRLPIEDLKQLPALAPGVFSLTDARLFSIRGGPSEAAALYVDGALLQNGQLGRPRLFPSLNGVHELSVITGLAGATRGFSLGVLDLTTPTGTRRYAADLRYRTDDVGGGVGQSRIWRYVGFNQVEANVSGPAVAGITMFAAASLEGQQSLETEKRRDVQTPIYTASGVDTIIRQPATVGDPTSDTTDLAIPRYVQFSGYCDRAQNGGYACEGLGVPFSSQGGHVLQGRLQRVYGSQSLVSLTLLSGRRQTRELTFAELYNPTNRLATRENSYAVILGWSHRELRVAGKPFTVEANLSLQSDKSAQGPLTAESEVASRQSHFLFEPLHFVTDFETSHDVTIAGTQYTGVHFLDRTQIACLQSGQAACADLVPFLDRNDLISSQPYRENPYAVVLNPDLPFYTQGLDHPFDLRRERRWQARVAADWSLSAAHTIQLGLEHYGYDTRRYAAGMISAFGVNAYGEKPVRRALWIANDLRVGGASIEAGVRLDRFDSRASYPATPGRLSSDPAFVPGNPTANFITAAAHSALSPQIRGSYRLSDRASIRMAAGNTARMPTFDALFAHKNTDLSMANASVFFGRDLGFAREPVYEIGGRIEAVHGFAVDVTVYSQRVVQEVVRLTRFTDPASGSPIDLRVFALENLGALTGFDATLEHRLSPWFTGYLAYTHQGGSALDHGRHIVAGSFALTIPERSRDAGTVEKIFENTGVFATLRVGTNARYTRSANQGLGLTLGEVGNPSEPLNASILPSHKSLDLRITRRLHQGRVTGSLFAESRNLFNWTNLVDIFTETGTVTNSVQRSVWVDQQIAQLETEANANGLAITDPLSGQPAVDLRTPGVCVGWASRNTPGSYAGGPADCVLLQRAERRFGNGDGLYTQPEYSAAFNAWYDLANAPYRFYGPGRRIRVGFELGF